MVRCNIYMDLPEEFESLSKFRATLGHKANHKTETNADYTILDSARFNQKSAWTKTNAEVSRKFIFFVPRGDGFTAGWYFF